MDKVPLSDCEWKIMTLLWKNAPLSMRSIHDALNDETGWSKHTIISFLKRMMAKGAISVEDTPSVKLYSPLLDEKRTIRQETRSMLGKLYSGSLSLMVSHLVEQDELSEDEINELMGILRKGKGVKM